MKLRIFWICVGIVFVLLLIDPMPRLAQTDKAVDIERLVLKKMGVDGNAIASFALSGKISRYDREGQKKGEFNLRIFKKNPNLIKVEIANESGAMVYGMDQATTWKLGFEKVTLDDLHEIHGWLRIWPDWFLAARTADKAYAMTGTQSISAIPVEPKTDPILLNPMAELTKLEIEDAIGPNSDNPGKDPFERRVVTYGIDKATNLIFMASWIEPYTANDDLNDPQSKRVLVQVYFLDYKQIQGIWWPSKLVHLVGYSVDSIIQLNDIALNPPIDDKLFKTPTQ
jgi:hypothetical protein